MQELSLKKLAIPIYFDMLLKLATIIINTYMISLVDVRLVGALGAGNQIFTLFVTVFSFLGVGCSVVVAQAVGAKNRSLAIRAIHTSIIFNAIVGLISGIFVFFTAKILLSLLQVPQNLLNESYVYLRILSVTFVIDAVAIVISAVIRVYGYTNYIMIISIIMNIVTIFGNMISLFGFLGVTYLGLFGIGISTVCGRITGIFLLIFVLIKIVKIRIYPLLFINFKIQILTKILYVGLTSAGENLLWVLQYLVAFRFVASMGEDSLTVQTIYFQISAFIFFTGSAISIANEVIVGRLVGANLMQKAYKQAFVSLKIGLFYTACFITVVFIFKEQIMNALNFNQNLKNLMRPLFTVTIFLEMSRTLNIIMVNALRASGDAKFPFYMGIIFMWGISIPVGWFLGIHMGIGILGIWIGFLCDEFLRGFANTIRWKNKKWQLKKLV